MFDTATAGSRPQPAGLAETEKRRPQCKGERLPQHFVHGFPEPVQGIDFENKVKMGVRNNRCGDSLAPMSREVALAKLAALARQRYGD